MVGDCSGSCDTIIDLDLTVKLPIGFAWTTFGVAPQAATREPREIERRHLLGLAAMYQRIADGLASEKPDEIQSAEAVRLRA